MYYFEVRIIYKDGTCAVYPKCQLSVVGKYIAIMPLDMNKDIIRIPIEHYKYIKAIKTVIKGGN